MIRVYNTLRGGKSFINLNYVSSIRLYGNKLEIYKASERESVGGNFLFFLGGNTNVETITCESVEDAEKEFENIREIMEDFYNKNK